MGGNRLCDAVKESGFQPMRRFHQTRPARNVWGVGPIQNCQSWQQWWIHLRTAVLPERDAGGIARISPFRFPI